MAGGSKAGMDGIKLLSLFISNLKAIGKSQKIKLLKMISESVDLKSTAPEDIAAIATCFFALDKKPLFFYSRCCENDDLEVSR